MRLTTALKLVVVLLAALAVGLVAAAKSMDFQRVKVLLAEQVHDATGRTLTISGPLELRLGLVPRVIATGVSLSNMAGGSRPEMVKIDRIEAEVALLPLLKREVRVQRLIVSAPDILLETNRAGKGNWAFASLPPTPESLSQPVVAAKDGAPAMRLTLRQVRIKNARLTWRDGKSGVARQLNLHKFMVQTDQSVAGRATLQVVGDYDARPLELSGQVAMPAAPAKPWMMQIKGNFDSMVAKVEGGIGDPLLMQGLDLAVAAQGDELGKLAKLTGLVSGDAPQLGPFKLAARLNDDHGIYGLADVDVSAGRRDGMVINGHGTIRDVLAPAGIDMQVTLESDNLSGLSRLTGGDVPSMGPLKLTGALSGGGEHWKLADIKSTLAGSDAAGELLLDLGRRPRLSGALTSNVLALADFTTPASKPGEKLAPKTLKPAGDGRLFPSDSLGLMTLQGYGADVSLRATRLDLGRVRLANAAADVHLANGQLALRPLRAGLADGTVDGEATLDVSGKQPAVALRLNAKGVDLGRALRDGGTNTLSGGRSDGSVDLRASGNSWRALMASLSGEVVVSVGPGQLNNTTLDWAGGDVLSQLAGSFNPLGRQEDTTALSCAAARFVARDGVAVADRGLAVETVKVNVVGSGSVDLRNETLDFGIAPRAREGIGLSLSTPLAGVTRVRGTLSNPTLGLDEAGVARTAASMGAAMATGGLSLVGEALYDRLLGETSPCQTALGKVAPAKPVVKAGAKKGKAQKSGAGILDGLLGR